MGNPGRPVGVGEAGEAVALEDVADRGARDAEERGQPMRTEAVLVAGGEDRVHPLLGQRPRRTPGPGGPILEAGLALGLVPAQPLPGRLAAHPGHVGRVGHGHPVDDDPVD